MKYFSDYGLCNINLKVSFENRHHTLHYFVINIMLHNTDFDIYWVKFAIVNSENGEKMEVKWMKIKSFLCTVTLFFQLLIIDLFSIKFYKLNSVIFSIYNALVCSWKNKKWKMHQSVFSGTETGSSFNLTKIE